MIDGLKVCGVPQDLEWLKLYSEAVQKFKAENVTLRKIKTVVKDIVEVRSHQ